MKKITFAVNGRPKECSHFDDSQRTRVVSTFWLWCEFRTRQFSPSPHKSNSGEYISELCRLSIFFSISPKIAVNATFSGMF